MILQKENKMLRQKAKQVENPEESDIKNLIKKMADAMFAEPDGIGIAAPQIGASLQIFLVAKDVFSPTKLIEKKSKQKREYLVFINPILKKMSRKKMGDAEGCLSVRGVYGEVSRAEKITIEYLDKFGKKQQRGASGLFARVIQHELDHLNGVLFIDKAKKLKKISNFK